MNRMAVRILALDFNGTLPAVVRPADWPRSQRPHTRPHKSAGVCREDACPGTCRLPGRGCPGWRCEGAGLWSATDVWDATDAEADTLGEPHRSKHQSFFFLKKGNIKASQATQGRGHVPACVPHSHSNPRISLPAILTIIA